MTLIPAFLAHLVVTDTEGQNDPLIVPTQDGRRRCETEQVEVGQTVTDRSSSRPPCVIGEELLKELE